MLSRKMIMFIQALVVLSSVTTIAEAAKASNVQASMTMSAAAGSSPMKLLTKILPLAVNPTPSNIKAIEPMLIEIARQKKAGYNPDAQMSAALNTIRTLLESMKTQIMLGHSTSQQELDTFYNALANCTVPPNTTFDHNEPEREAVVACRRQEENSYNNWQWCLGNASQCNSTADQTCTQWDTNLSTATPIMMIGSCNADVCAVTDLDSLIALFNQTLNEYDTANQTCTEARQECVAYSQLCPANHTSYTSTQTNCNTLQEAFESKVCNFSSNRENAWVSYKTCYNQKHSTLVSSEQTEQSNEAGRWQQYRAVLRIECLVGALEVNDTSAALAVCVNKVYTKPALLNITYPTTRSDFIQNQTCTSGLYFPQSNNYLYSYYFENWDIMTRHQVATLSTANCNTFQSLYCSEAAIANVTTVPR